jgi:N-acetylglucosaminyldiphosphoundecaprenol N-acetyl-beta-D-mannosaminyltransferase
MHRDSARNDAVAHVDGHAINICTLDDAVACVRARLKARRGFNFATLNLDHLVKLRADSAFGAAYERMNFVSADGAPVAALARQQTAAVRRATGADLLVPLCRMAAHDKIPVALFGSTPESLEAAADRLRALAPGLDVVYIDSPAFGFDPFSSAADAAGAAIAASGARLCFVCLGAPKQELFADRVAQSHPEIGFVCVGAAADFQSGAQIRAPAFVQSVGMEWAWRLATQPRRMAGRYFQCAALLARLRIAQSLVSARAKGQRALEAMGKSGSMLFSGHALGRNEAAWPLERCLVRKTP